MSETLYVKRGRRYLKWSELDDRVRSEDAKRIARLTEERDRYRDTLLARHGGEPLVLLQELDEAREEIASLTAEVERLQARTDGEEASAMNCGDCYDKDVKIDKLQAVVEAAREHSNLTHSLILGRDGKDPDPIYVDLDNGIVTINVDRYVIIPMERYGEVVPTIRDLEGVFPPSEYMMDSGVMDDDSLVDRMRPVVNAALAWHAAPFSIDDNRQTCALLDAIRDYRALDGGRNHSADVYAKRYVGEAMPDV